MINPEHSKDLENGVSRLESLKLLYEKAKSPEKIFYHNQINILEEEIKALKFLAETGYKRAPIPKNEEDRIFSLRALKILDTPFEPLFDSITELAAHVCDTPICLISLIDEHRQWFKSNHGLPGVTETPRDQAFCAHTILQDVILEVPDATQDTRFEDNPLVTGKPDIRFYAGAPLSFIQGINLGSLCVIDRSPRYLSPHQKQSLQKLAEIVSETLHIRHQMVSA